MTLDRTATEMRCARCVRPIIGGWADGQDGIICQACMNLATSEASIREAIEHVHRLAHYGHEQRNCPVCREDDEILAGHA